MTDKQKAYKETIIREFQLCVKRYNKRKERFAKMGKEINANEYILLITEALKIEWDETNFSELVWLFKSDDDLTKERVLEYATYKPIEPTLIKIVKNLIK